MMGSESRDSRAEEVAHDLNNVFQTILQAAEAISAEPELADIAAIITRSVEQGRRILGLSESDAPVVVSQAIAQAAQFVRDYLEVHRWPSLEVAVDLDPSISLRMKTSTLERIFVNLLVNAAEAARNSGRDRARVRIEGRVHSDVFVLLASDNGPGIPESLLSLVLTPRFSGKPGGEGLGLHIVESSLAECGGTVVAGNQEGGGALFTMRFPVQLVTASAEMVRVKTQAE